MPVVAAEAAGAVPDGVVAIEMAPDEYTKACTGAPPALLAELQGHLVRGDDVVATDDALVFHTHRICSRSTAPIRTKAERRSRGGHPNSALKSGMKRSRK